MAAAEAIAAAAAAAAAEAQAAKAQVAAAEEATSTETAAEATTTMLAAMRTTAVVDVDYVLATLVRRSPGSRYAIRSTHSSAVASWSKTLRYVQGFRLRVADGPKVLWAA
eukprot:4747892-Pleurochrysis_carterae.AAC.1